MIFAQIKDQEVKNTLILNEYELSPLFFNNPVTGDSYDLVLRICAFDPIPGIGWTFDGTTFYPPPEPEVIDE